MLSNSRLGKFLRVLMVLISINGMINLNLFFIILIFIIVFKNICTVDSY